MPPKVISAVAQSTRHVQATSDVKDLAAGKKIEITVDGVVTDEYTVAAACKFNGRIEIAGAEIPE